MYRVVETTNGAFHVERFSAGVFSGIERWRWIFRYPYNDEAGAIAHAQRLSKDEASIVWAST